MARSPPADRLASPWCRWCAYLFWRSSSCSPSGVSPRTWAASRAPLAHARPNVLLVSIDSLRADHVARYGYPRETSPTLDALAREGALFQTAVSPTSWTLPAHLTLLTGLPPEVHGVVALPRGSAGGDDARRGAAGRRLRQPPASSRLRTSTPATASRTASTTTTTTCRAATASARIGATPRRPSSSWSAHGSRAGRTAARGGRSSSSCTCGTCTTTTRRRRPTTRCSTPTTAGNVTGDDFETNPRVHAGMDPRDLAAPHRALRRRDPLHRRTPRPASSRQLRELRRARRHDRRRHRRPRRGVLRARPQGPRSTLYDESIHVPLIVRYPPRLAPERRVAAQVRLMDVAPTILGLAGVAAPPGFGGARCLTSMRRST